MHHLSPRSSGTILLLTILVVLALQLFPSCSNENVIGNTADNAKKVEVVVFGAVVADSADSTNATADSIHAYLSIAGLPHVDNAMATVNHASYAYTESQQKARRYLEPFRWVHSPSSREGLTGRTGCSQER